MVIKVVICIIIVLLCTFGAYVLCIKYLHRKKFFYDFKCFNDRYKNEITYLKTPLFTFFDKYSYYSVFQNLLDVYKSNNSIETYLESLSYITEDEIQFICDYFEMLGKSDCTSQLNYVSSVGSVLSELSAKSKKDYEKYSNVYIKLGLALGLLIVIIIY